SPARQNAGETPAPQRTATPVGRRKVKVVPGDNRIPFTCTVRGQRSAVLTARIDGFRDTIAENNSATAMVFSTGRPKALVLAHDPSSVQHLGPVLTGERIDFDFRPTLGAGQRTGLPRTLEELQNYDLLILANVPAADLPQDRQEIIRRYVRDFGGGLVVIGGEQAFTPGGYHGTTLEEVLPVWCDFHRRQQRPSLAMVLVLDRSGSMEGSSIRLAKEAIRRAVEMLEPTDQVGVLVFDDTTRWISPIAPCVDKRPILEKIATITAGGETDMGPAMDKAYLALNECFAKLKHVIIMTDGVSHPGDFESQARKMAEAGITVSMVALGQQAAREEAEDIARLGKGRHYFCVDPADIPRIFALETASASRVGIVEQPFFPKVVGASSAMPASEIRSAPSLLGYVGTRPKPTSQLILSSLEGDPLLIWWRYGLGVSVAFTSDLQSRWAAPWLRWQGLGRFWGQLLRHALRRDQAQDFALDLKRRGTRIELTLDAIDPAGAFINGAKASLHVVGPQGSRDVEVPQVAPGRYAISLEAATPGTYSLEPRLQYQGRLVYLERRGLATGFADELRVRPANEELLRSIASLSGGRYRPSAAAIFAPMWQTVPRTEELWRYFLAAAMLILLFDVAIRRTVRL
ncbi:MAG: VWA domain-containing protein, partial [Thermoguttaceae bacterium]